MADNKTPEKSPEEAPLQPAPDGVNNDKKKVEQFQMENGDEP
jgi:hypothetical protein